MPTLTIDSQQITVPAGTNVLEAAQRLGIVIPHFCYHEALGAVGACRLCAMSFVAGPVKGVQMACMVQAQDGMVVESGEAQAVELRSHVIEWLMTNHPHDCPVCDEGGECRLQEMTIAGGHSRRRYTGKKRTYRNQELGPYIAHEMNRCIACYRCLRTYRDYLGGTDFGVFGSRNRLYFGRLRDGRLESPFSGNLVDVCPTGVFTDKTFRFRSRAWDLQEAPSLCPHCSLGCATVPGARYRELQRVRAGVNREVNGFFICDRGRFENGAVNHPDRPRQARVDRETLPVSAAIDELRARLKSVSERHGAGSIALLGSPRATLEANVLLRDLAEQLGTAPPVFDPHPAQDRAARAAVHLGAHAVSLAEIATSDLVVLIGADPQAEAPMLAVALRQAVRQGGRVVVIDPRPVELPCRFTRLPLDGERLAPLLAALGGAERELPGIEEQAMLAELRAGLAAAQRPVLVGGAAQLGGVGAETFAAAVLALAAAGQPIGAMLLLAGPNSCGAALLAGEGRDFKALREELVTGRIRALVCLECDPWADSDDPAGTAVAIDLAGLELLAVCDWQATRAAARADLFLPTRAWVETEGCYVSNEGRLQAFAKVMEPGLPLRETSPEVHPPREFSLTTPGSEAWPAWRILARLLGRSEELSALRREMAALDSSLAGLDGLEAGGTGRRLAPRAQTGVAE